MNRALCFAAVLLLAGCSAGPVTRDTPVAYDFGPQREEAGAAKTVRASVLVSSVTAPAWLDSSAVVYRLNYQDSARWQIYANSRWVTAPATLLTQRLRSCVAAVSEGGVVGPADGARADYALRVELEEFTQVFDAADNSRGVVVARASLINSAKRTLVAQKTFTFERAAASSDAYGGVRALAAASAQLVDAITAWTAAGIAQDKK
jgi:cholesterol transport system auxiliary component